MNIHELNTILNKHNASYNNIWREVLEPNQNEINNTIDYEDKRELQKTHNKIVIYINEQSELIEYLLKKLASAPNKQEIEFYKRYCNQARFYIKNLGGNLDVLNYVKNTDIC